MSRQNTIKTAQLSGQLIRLDAWKKQKHQTEQEEKNQPVWYYRPPLTGELTSDDFDAIRLSDDQESRNYWGDLESFGVQANDALVYLLTTDVREGDIAVVKSLIDGSHYFGVLKRKGALELYLYDDKTELSHKFKTWEVMMRGRVVSLQRSIYNEPKTIKPLKELRPIIPPASVLPFKKILPDEPMTLMARYVLALGKQDEGKPKQDDWQSCNFDAEIIKREAELIKHAFEKAEGRVARAAKLLGMTHQRLLAMLKDRHAGLEVARKPAQHRRKSIIKEEESEEDNYAAKVQAALDLISEQSEQKPRRRYKLKPDSNRPNCAACGQPANRSGKSYRCRPCNLAVPTGRPRGKQLLHDENEYPYCLPCKQEKNIIQRMKQSGRNGSRWLCDACQRGCAKVYKQWRPTSAHGGKGRSKVEDPNRPNCKGCSRPMSRDKLRADGSCAHYRCHPCEAAGNRGSRNRVMPTDAELVYCVKHHTRMHQTRSATGDPCYSCKACHTTIRKYKAPRCARQKKVEQPIYWGDSQVSRPDLDLLGASCVKCHSRLRYYERTWGGESHHSWRCYKTTHKRIEIAPRLSPNGRIKTKKQHDLTRPLCLKCPSHPAMIQSGRGNKAWQCGQCKTQCVKQTIHWRAKGNAKTDDPNRPDCPTCNKPAIRNGSTREKARYYCTTCKIRIWAGGEEPRTRTGHQCRADNRRVKDSARPTCPSCGKPARRNGTSCGQIRYWCSKCRTKVDKRWSPMRFDPNRPMCGKCTLPMNRGQRTATQRYYYCRKCKTLQTVVLKKAKRRSQDFRRPPQTPGVDAELFTRACVLVERIVPKNLPPLFREDVCQNMLVDVWERRVEVHELTPALVKFYTVEQNRLFGHKNKMRSLETPMGENENRTLGELIPG